MAPIFLLLRLFDGDTPCAGNVYYKTFKLVKDMEEYLETREDLSAPQKEKTLEIVNGRWDFIHTDVHATA